VTDPFHSSRYSINHAKRRLKELETALVDFRASNPYAHVVEPNSERAFKSHKIRLVKEIPDIIPGIVFDTANNLRSSLDQAGHAIALSVGKPGNHAHFPFGNDKASASGRAGSSSKDLPQEIFDTMMAFKPYKGGDNLLWSLNNLANTDKHQVIAPAVATIGLAITRYKQYAGIEPSPRPPRWDRLKNEMEIARTPLDSTDKVDFHGQFFVAIGDVKGIDGQPAIDVLAGMLGRVEMCFAGIEAAARRFGFVT
jgi:hypothetical protein